MSKAILVIDMPDTCGKCPLCASYQENAWAFREYWCPAINHAEVEPLAKKPYDCPLRPLPEKVRVHMDDWADGYNTCLDEILGDGKQL